VEARLIGLAGNRGGRWDAVESGRWKVDGGRMEVVRGDRLQDVKLWEGTRGSHHHHLCPNTSHIETGAAESGD
jgi:hypothetical protein